MTCGEWSERDELGRGGGEAGEECGCGSCPWSSEARDVVRVGVGYQLFRGAVMVAAHKMTKGEE